jgi:drug/metabolite transporter (DMT)-like permease
MFAFASAVCYAVAAALQQSEAARAPAGRLVSAGLLVYLTRRPRWVAGLAAMVAGAGLHLLALSRGPLPLVQPVGVASMLFALPLGAALHARRVRRADWWGAAAVAVGLAVVLLIVRTATAAPALSSSGTTVLVAVSAAGIGLCGALLGGVTGRYRPVVLAAAGGVGFGATSVLARVVSHHVALAGPGALVGWPTLALVVFATVGTALTQCAYRAGSLPAALSTVTVVDPVVAIGFAVMLLGESVHSSATGVAAAAAAGLLVVAGVITLARSQVAAPPLDPPGGGQRTQPGMLNLTRKAVR